MKQPNLNQHFMTAETIKATNALGFARTAELRAQRDATRVVNEERAKRGLPPVLPKGLK
jgi:hypothetical protein